MSDHSKIEWTDATWNVVIGCDKVSPGCDNCYAIRTAHRMQANPNPKISSAYAGTESGGDWTGRVNELEERLDLPLRWRRPRRIFVNSQSDLFHDQVDDWFIAKVFAVMALAPQHTFQILTKRHGRMRSLLNGDLYDLMVRALDNPDLDWDGSPITWPLPNVWLGVSVEDQKRADLRVPALLDTPAAVRFLSCEPLLGPVDLSPWLTERGRERAYPHHDTTCGAGQGGCFHPPCRCACHRLPDVRLDWVIVGGESGPGARPMHPAWVRHLRDQCDVAAIAFHFKQWGEWAPAPWGVERLPGETDEAYKARAEAICATAVITNPMPDGSWALYEPDYKPWSAESGGLPREYAGGSVRRVGKAAAGRELDGRTWDEFPA